MPWDLQRLRGTLSNCAAVSRQLSNATLSSSHRSECRPRLFGFPASSYSGLLHGSSMEALCSRMAPARSHRCELNRKESKFECKGLLQTIEVGGQQLVNAQESAFKRECRSLTWNGEINIVSSLIRRQSDRHRAS